MKLKYIAAVLVLSSVVITQKSHAQAGLALSGVGAVNRSFGGTAVAAPIDVTGALRWNPATISAFDRNQFAMSLELLEVDAKLSSSVDAIGVSGSTHNNDDASPIPSAAFVYKPSKDSALTYGFGLLSVGGFRVNYPADPTNPVTAPQPPVSQGLGRIIGEAEFTNIVPTASYQMNEEFSFGLAPVLSIARVQVDPYVFGTPNANGSYPPGTESDYTFGGGFQLGLYYKNKDGIQLGAAYNSAQWYDDLTIDSYDQNGLPRTETYDLDFPQIVSIGAGYSGIDKWLFASDLKYFDYSNADGFKEEGFDSTGALKGLAWDSIWAVSAGVQYLAADWVSLRVGYFYNESPISSSTAGFNLASPLITQHLLSAGTSFNLTDDLSLSFAYLHAFENDVEGQIQSPLGPVPGTSVKSTVSADAYAMGLTLRM